MRHAVEGGTPRITERRQPPFPSPVVMTDADGVRAVPLGHSNPGEVIGVNGAEAPRMKPILPRRGVRMQ